MQGEGVGQDGWGVVHDKRTGGMGEGSTQAMLVGLAVWIRQQPEPSWTPLPRLSPPPEVALGGELTGGTAPGHLPLTAVLWP